MGVNRLPKTVTRQRRGCDLNPGPSAPETSTLTTRLPNHLLACRAIANTALPYRRAGEMHVIVRGENQQRAVVVVANSSAACSLTETQLNTPLSWIPGSAVESGPWIRMPSPAAGDRRGPKK